MSRYTEIGIDDVIARTKMQLRLVNTTEWDPFFEVVIEEGLRSMAPLSMYKKQQCNVELVNRQAALPKGFYKLLGIRYQAPIVGTTNTQCQPALYVDKKFMSDCGCSTDSFTGDLFDCNQGFQIIKNFIHWNSSIEDTTIQLAYFGMNLNANGRIVIYEDYERALTAYACYKYTQSWPDKYPQSLRMEYNSEWVNQRGKIRGEDVAFHFSADKREIQNIFNALAASDWLNY